MTTTNSPYLAEERNDDDPVLRVSNNVVTETELLSALPTAPPEGGFWNDVGVLMGVGPDLTQSIASAIDTLATASTNKPILSSINHGTASYTRNTSCWITADKTCIAVWNSRSNAQAYSGCTISPRHVLLALHTGIQVGDTFRFLTNGNLVVTRTISSLATVSGDLQVRV